MGHSKSSSEGAFIEIEPYIKKQEKFQMNHLTLHLKKLGGGRWGGRTPKGEGNKIDQSRNKKNSFFKMYKKSMKLRVGSLRR